MIFEKTKIGHSAKCAKLFKDSPPKKFFEIWPQKILTVIIKWAHTKKFVSTEMGGVFRGYTDWLNKREHETYF